MRKIYLVKKNPELPADGNNWLVMNSFEFRNFIQTPEGQKRRDRFGQLDACSVDDVIIIAECGTETAKQWRSEKDRHDYLAEWSEKNLPLTPDNVTFGSNRFTTRMCEAGVNINVIQDALGYTDISTTLNICTDVTKELKTSEFKGLDNYFKAQ